MRSYADPGREQWDELVRRPTQTYREVEGLVAEIFEEVAERGDEAVLKYARRFDGAEQSSLKVEDRELAAAEQALSPGLKESIRLAKDNIE